MAIFELRINKDPILRRKAVEVRNFDFSLSSLTENMFETMYESKGIGLAAPQIGISQRLIVIDIEEVDAEFFTNSKVNLTASVRDAILLALPIIQLCKKNCLGLCSECGQNLNESQCKCGDNAAIDPRFEKLKQLKEKLQHKENN